MGLTAEQIAEIYNKKAAPRKSRASTGGAGKRQRRFNRQQTQYAKLPANHLIRYHDGPSLRCESYGCGCPTYVYFRNHPLCSTHALIAMVHEVNLLTSHGKIRISELDRHEAELGTSEVFVKTFTHGPERSLDDTSGASEPGTAAGSLVAGTPQNHHNGDGVPLVTSTVTSDNESGEDGDNQYL